jgi:tetratricopeptide (TPR) repeat protein
VSSALVQSPELDVYDGQRLSDLMANEKASKLDNAFLQKHGISRAIDGTILKSGSQLQVLGRIVDTKDGRPVRSYNVAGPADSGLFHLVGGLIPNLQVALEVNLNGDKEAEGWLREITTTSADAYRLYLRGHQALLASHWKESAAAYEKAVELDPNFAAAWAEMSGAYWNLGDMKNLTRVRTEMKRLRPMADHRTQLKIDLQEAVVAWDAPALIRSASELAQLYPENRFYTYLLGRGYYTTQQYQRCLDTLAPLVAQRYSWAYTYVLSAKSAIALGDTSRARSLYETGFEVSKGEPELAYAYAKYLHEIGDDTNARRVIDAGLASPTLAEGPIAEGELRVELARNYQHRGDDANARAQLLRAAPLVPKEDEAWPDVDSLMKHYGLAR